MVYRRTSWQVSEFFRDLPVTKIIIAIWVVGFLASILGVPLAAYLRFSPDRLPNILTGLLTNALAVGPDLIGVLLNGLMLYWFGGSLERGWGTRTYLLFLAGVSVAAVVSWQIPCLLVTHQLQPMNGGAWLLISATVVAWAWLNPEQTVLFWFVLPLKAKWIGWITIALVFFMYPMGTVGTGLLFPVFGFFALGSIGFAWAFVYYQRNWAWIPRRASGKGSPRVIRHPASGIFGALLRPLRELQRRRRVARLQRTFRIDK
ncbi:MAG TPA: hypothetical protein VGL77_20555 [Armatimonadota bacterium]|jgi:hypothetical protein